MFLFFSDSYWLLFKSPTGNNIIRRMVGKLTDLMVLNQICDKLSTQYNNIIRQFRHDHRVLKYSKCCLDLTIRRRVSI